jgi:antitoxin (DNA-binding transcriptional repressor) of toxin-antitoxin stability system
MSRTISLDEAQASLRNLIQNLALGDELIITDNHRPVAKLVSESPKRSARLRPPPGLAKG